MAEAGLVVADSSVWLAWLTDAAGADRFAGLFAASRERLLVPSIAIYEVHRWYLAHDRTNDARLVSGVMAALPVIALDASLAATAAGLAKRHRLAIADAIMLASAYGHQAELWTQDNDFARLPGVRLFERL